MATILWKIEHLQEILGYRFHNPELAKNALTHPSLTEGKPVSEGYERLEFLGDAVVGLIVTEELYQAYPDLDEGQLTQMKVALISGDSLSRVALEYGIKDCINFGRSERGVGARGIHSALENVYESITGALYLDGGLDAARKWVVSSLKPAQAGIELVSPTNPKSILQEKVQADGYNAPAYRITAKRGPAHAPMFESECLVGGKVAGTGRGSSKKHAEAAAAANALVNMGYLTQEQFDSDNKQEADSEAALTAEPSATAARKD